ncbi:hypothetical protein GUA87_02100 [Sneathiella sp. P13V-1]|uniref:hypothetical protein n=1 Tax=Sneathiella sp. P13V-1 TaxID=2697366 RepID=UPI00187B44FE|nr:hypothetical protein [Sneathiella sp. P13V-1]MBE7635621.1 hypothetical protein [Sneathiella sp. P13V-1]
MLRSIAFRIGLLALLGAVLSACAATPERQVLPELNFNHVSQIILDVSEVRVVNEYRSPLKAPNVEHEMPVKIDQAVRKWAEQRLRANGNQNAFAVLTIKDASVVEKQLEKKTGLTGFFTNDQSERYEFRVMAELRIEEVNGNKAIATAEVSRIKTVAEDITLNDRDMMYFQQVEQLMSDFNVEMVASINKFMQPFLNGRLTH